MKKIIQWTLAAAVVLGVSAAAAPAQAQISIGVEFGGRPAPVIRPMPSVRPAPPRPTNWTLGVQGRDVRDGFRITEVYRHSPAARAGLEPGDVIHAVNGEPVRCEYDLLMLLRSSGGHADMLVHDVRRDRDVKIHVDLVPASSGPVYSGRPTYGRPSYDGRPGRYPSTPDHGHSSHGGHGREL